MQLLRPLLLISPIDGTGVLDIATYVETGVSSIVLLLKLMLQTVNERLGRKSRRAVRILVCHHHYLWCINGQSRYQDRGDQQGLTAFILPSLNLPS